MSGQPSVTINYEAMELYSKAVYKKKMRVVEVMSSRDQNRAF